MSEESVGDAGASALGYYGGVFGPGGRSVAANGFTGALHLWQRSTEATPAGIPPSYKTTLARYTFRDEGACPASSLLRVWYGGARAESVCVWGKGGA